MSIFINSKLNNVICILNFNMNLMILIFTDTCKYYVFSGDHVRGIKTNHL